MTKWHALDWDMSRCRGTRNISRAKSELVNSGGPFWLKCSTPDLSEMLKLDAVVRKAVSKRDAMVGKVGGNALSLKVLQRVKGASPPVIAHL